MANEETQVRWILNTRGPQAPADLRAHLEKERDHFKNTTLLAGLDPRDNATPMFVHGHEDVIAHMDRGIAAAVTIAQGETRPVNVTLVGLFRPSPDDKEPGDVLNVSITVAPLKG